MELFICSPRSRYYFKLSPLPPIPGGPALFASSTEIVDSFNTLCLAEPSLLWWPWAQATFLGPHGFLVFLCLGGALVVADSVCALRAGLVFRMKRGFPCPPLSPLSVFACRSIAATRPLAGRFERPRLRGGKFGAFPHPPDLPPFSGSCFDRRGFSVHLLTIFLFTNVTNGSRPVRT